MDLRSLEQEHRFADIDGVKTHYVVAGEGPLLLLLHGHAPGSCADVELSDVIRHFSKAGFTVCAFDQPGFGLTENPSDFSVESNVDHAKAFIEFIAPRSYAMWGCSMGSYIAARIALEDPRVNRLIIMPASALPQPNATPLSAEGKELVEMIMHYTPSLESAQRFLQKVVFDSALVTDNMIQQFHNMTLGKNAIASSERIRAERPRPIIDELRHLRTSSLILWGADDQAVVVERGFSLFKNMLQSELHVFQQCRHWPHIDQRERTYRIAFDFLQSHKAEE